MLTFTKQEQVVLSAFLLVVLAGSMLQMAFKKYPLLKDVVNLADSDHLYAKVNINTASLEELVALPYIGEYTANNIIEYRQTHGPFADIEQIKNVKGIRAKNYEKFCRYLKI
jgi:competence protein ComEA